MSTVTWTNPGSGDWNTATNWSSNPNLPGTTDAVTIATAAAATIAIDQSVLDEISSLSLASDDTLSISTGELKIDGASTLAGSISLSGGNGGGELYLGGSATIGGSFSMSPNSELLGSGTLTVNGLASLSGGAQTGSGTTDLKGQTTLSYSYGGNYTYGESAGYALTLEGGRILENQGTLNWTGGFVDPSDIGLAGGTVDNAAGATFDLQAPSLSIVNLGGVNAFDNAGLLEASAGTGADTIGVALVNTGTVKVLTGEVDLSGGGSSAAGAFTVATGATLLFGGGTFQLGAGSIGGATAVDFGTLALGANAVTLTNVSDLGGVLSGTGTLTINGSAGFSGGAQTGSGTTVLEGASGFGDGVYSGQDDDLGIALSLDGGRTLLNEGTMTWAGRSQYGTNIDLGYNPFGSSVGGGTIDNASGATFNIQADGLDIAGFSGTNTFDNAGLLEKTAGTGTDTIGVALHNTGTVVVYSGVLDLAAAVTGSGTVQVDAGATVELGGADSNNIIFGTGGTGILKVAAPAGFSGALVDLQYGDEVDFTGVTLTSVATTPTSVTVTTSGGLSYSYALQGAESPGAFAIVADGAGGDAIVFQHTVGSTFTLTGGVDVVNGGGGPTTVTATSGTLSAGDKINAGTNAANTLVLQGAGGFNLAAPTTLTGITTVDAQEGQAAYSNGSVSVPNGVQAVYLRSGLNVTVNVASDASPVAGDPSRPEIVIYGANDSDVINLGNGNDIVYLGSASETVNGGGGNNSVFATAATIGATIHGGTGTSSLFLNGGGTAIMGSNITGVSQVNLLAPPYGQTQTAWTLTTNSLSGLLIADSAGGNSDVINLTAAGQSVISAGNTVDHVNVTAAAVGDRVVGSSATTPDTLEITQAGTYVLNAADANVYVQLDTGLHASTVTLGSGAGVSISGGGFGGDTLIAGGYGQTLVSGNGTNFVGFGGGGTTFKGQSSLLDNDTIKNFGISGDKIDILDLAYSPGLPIGFTESPGGASGTLTVGTGAAAVKVLLFGHFMAGNFHAASDGSTGTAITYSPPQPVIAAAHG